MLTRYFNYIPIALFVLIFLVYNVVWKMEKFTKHLEPLFTNNKNQLEFTSDLPKFQDNFDGNNNRIRRHVFFDLGTNNGDSIKYFMEPVDKPENAIHGYGAKNGAKWEIYSFEANPLYEKRLTYLKSRYEQSGHLFYLFITSAASVADEKLQFFLDTRDDYHLGSSLESKHRDVIKSNLTKILVDAYDVSKLIRRYSVDDKIIVKIDIEGTEFRLLQHFLTHDTYKYIDVIGVEFHSFLEPQNGLINFFIESFKVFNITFVDWI